MDVFCIQHCILVLKPVSVFYQCKLILQVPNKKEDLFYHQFNAKQTTYRFSISAALKCSASHVYEKLPLG